MQLSKNTLTEIRNMVQDDVLIFSDIEKLKRSIAKDTQTAKNHISNYKFDEAKMLIEILDTNARAVKMWEAVLKA